MEVADAFNSKLYVPSSISYSCCFPSGDVIYCYRSRQTNAYNIRDSYYTRFGYLRYTDNVYIGSSFNYTCIESNRITNDVWYRLDISNILITFVIILLIPLTLCYLLLKRFRKR